MAKKKRVAAKNRVIELPKGFTAISAGSSAWDYVAQPLLEGTLVKIEEIDSRFKDPETKKFKKQKFAVIHTKKGEDLTVWESAGTRPLFDLKKGKQVAIAFQGTMKIKGRSKPMKLFRVGVK